MCVRVELVVLLCRRSGRPFFTLSIPILVRTHTFLCMKTFFRNDKRKKEILDLSLSPNRILTGYSSGRTCIPSVLLVLNLLVEAAGQYTFYLLGPFLHVMMCTVQEL